MDRRGEVVSVSRRNGIAAGLALRAVRRDDHSGRRARPSVVDHCCHAWEQPLVGHLADGEDVRGFGRVEPWWAKTTARVAALHTRMANVRRDGLLVLAQLKG